MPWYSFVTDSWERFKRMYAVMGGHFVLVIVLIEQLLQAFVFGGGGGGFVGLPILFLLRQYGTLTAGRIQVLKTIAVSPWALKPLFGMISDCIYIGGFNRMPYILGTLVLAILSCLAVVLGWPVSPVVATLLFFLMFLQIAVADLLIEAAYIAKIRRHRDVAPDLVSFVDVGSSLFQMASIVCVGLLLHYVEEFQYIYLVPILPFAVTLGPIYANWIGEREYTHREPYLVVGEPVPINDDEEDGDSSTAMPSDDVSDSDEGYDNRLYNLLGRWCYYQRSGDEPEPLPLIGVDYQRAQRNWRLFLLASVVVAMSLVTSTIGLVTSNTVVLFVLSVLCAPLMIAAFALLTDTQTAKLQAFVLLQNMFTVSIDTAEFFFLTDTVAQYPEGPHFSNFFVVTVMGLMATVLAMVGGLTYNMFMTGWSYRKVLVLANLGNIFFSAFNIIFYMRLNLLLGIPDQLFVVGSGALQVVTGSWANMPFKVMMLQMCPRDVAATSYALLAGSSNLGSALSQYQGAFLLDQLGIRPTGANGEGAQFSNLWIAVLVNTLLPIVPLALIWFLIPEVGQTSSLAPSPQELTPSPAMTGEADADQEIELVELVH